MSRPVQQEYAMLREEIMETMKSQNSLSTFVSTTICTFIGVVIALDSPNPLLYLIPFIVLVPAAFKEANYQKRVAYLASYLIVFLEGDNSFLWETRYHRFAQSDKTFSTRLRAIFETLEFTLFGILCYVLFFFRYHFLCFSGCNVFDIPFLTVIKEILLIFAPPVLIVIIAWNMFNYWNFRKVIQKNIIEWRRYRSKEYRK